MLKIKIKTFPNIVDEINQHRSSIMDVVHPVNIKQLPLWTENTGLHRLDRRRQKYTEHLKQLFNILEGHLIRV